MHKSGPTVVEIDQRSGRPQTTQNAAVVENGENLIMKDRRLVIRETAEQKKMISTDSRLAILGDHAEIRVAAKFVHKFFFSRGQKKLRFGVAKVLLDLNKNEQASCDFMLFLKMKMH
ncbi:hypothetical protein TNCV_4012761 [Trichonephila clavipes]|nr:hypothetical protein TNCV_4012761 [Trichonephila clavipes]